MKYQTAFTGLILGTGLLGQVLAADPIWLPVPEDWVVHGRTQIEGDHVMLGWNGSGIEGTFTGTRIGLKWSPTKTHFDVWIDGEKRPVLWTSLADSVLWLATDLTPGEHSLRLQKRSEQGVPTLRLIGLDAGGTLKPSVSASRKWVEFYGDSQLAGYGVESTTRTCTGGMIDSLTNGTRTWGPVWAQSKGVRGDVMAMSGLGLIRNYGGADPENPFPTFALRKSRVNEGLLVKGSQEPDLLVIALASNDFSTPLAPEEAWANRDAFLLDWRRAAHAFADQLRKERGNVPIVWVEYFGANSQGSQQLKLWQAEQKAAGYEDVYILKMPSAKMTACQWHFNIEDNQNMALRLGQFVDSLDLLNRPKGAYLGEVVSIAPKVGVGGNWNRAYDLLGRPLNGVPGRSLSPQIHVWAPQNSQQSGTVLWAP
jgi:hypothetical protein